MADSADLHPAQPRCSQGLGAGWVCSVGHGLLRVVAVQVNLQQDSDVHKYLQESTDGELERGLIQDEVNSLERVPTGPHQHHLDAKRQKKGKSVYWEEPGFGLDLLCQRTPPSAARIYTQQWVGTPCDRGRQPSRDRQHWTWKGGSNSLLHTLQHSYLSNYSSEHLWLWRYSTFWHIQLRHLTQWGSVNMTTTCWQHWP